tara:strand:- start:8633 stop:9406 length:774 start_codon:yes stop_codon:yes gene_type:complete
MIVQKELLTKIQDLGLNSYEAKIWTALLSRGISSAGELSDIANVPRSRAYDVLESLEKKGFVVMKLGKPIKYIAVAPNEVVSRVKKRVQLDSDERINMLENIKNTKVFSELELLHKGIDMVDHTEISKSFRTREASYLKMKQLVDGAKKSVVLVGTEKGVKKKLDSLRNNLKRADKRGVKIKVGAPISKTNKSYLDKTGFNVINTKLNSRFVVVDNKHVMFMMVDDSLIAPAYDAGVWFESEMIGSALGKMFEVGHK